MSSDTGIEQALEGAKALAGVARRRVWVEEPVYRPGALDDASTDPGIRGVLERMVGLRVQAWLTPITVEDRWEIDLEQRAYASVAARKMAEFRARGIQADSVVVAIHQGAQQHMERSWLAAALKRGTRDGGVEVDQEGNQVRRFTREDLARFPDDLVNRLWLRYMAELESSPFFGDGGGAPGSPPPAPH